MTVPVLDTRGLTKRFPGVLALDGVDFELLPGEVHALVGENGAGKSTLIKVLTGVYQPDGGELRHRGEPARFATPLHAQRDGIATIYQEVDLLPLLSVARNLYLGREPKRFGLIDFARMHREASEALRGYGVDVDVRRPLGTLSMGARQMVALARAVSARARVVVMDEPTSSLEPREVETLFEAIEWLRGQGVAVVYVSHRLDELYQVCDRVTVLRDGRVVHRGAMADLERLRLVSLMLGRDMERVEREGATTFSGDREAWSGTPALEAEGLTARHRLHDVSLTVRPGEVVGLGGLLVLLLVLLVAGLSLEGFLALGNLNRVLVSSSFLAIIALGMTFVIITGGIDLSVGTVFALGGVLAAWAAQYGALALMAVPLVVCGLIGLLNGLLIARARLAPFIVTLATMLGAWGLMLSVSDEGNTTYLVPDGLVLSPLVHGRLFGVLGYPFLLVVALFVVGGLVLRRTTVGQHVYAVGGNEQTAALMGVPVAWTKVAVYTFSGLCAGAAGALNAVWLGSGVTIFGIGIELQAISAVVIGGTLLTGGYGFVGSTLVGVLLLGAIQNIINAVGTLTSAFQEVVSGLFLITVVLVQSRLSRSRGSG